MNIDIGYFYMYMRMKLLQMLLYTRKRYAIRLHAYMAEDNPSTDCIYISVPVLPGLMMSKLY